MRNWMMFGGAVSVAVVLTVVLAAQAPQAPGAGAPGGRGQGAAGRGAGAMPVAAVDPHDIAGFWQLPPDAREGRNVPDAVLAPAVTRAALAAIEKKDREAIRYCDQIGMPAAMGLGTVYELRISPKFMVILTEYGAAQNRWIYLNRSTHIDKDAYEPSLNGDSIGHWDGDTLVVESTMFSGEHGIFSIPGGGFRTEGSTLVERFTLLKNGQVLQLISTWTDPKVFRTPQTYEYRYNKLPSTYEPHPSSPCDQYDDQRVAFLAATAAKKITP